MLEKITYGIAAALILIFVPCLMTNLICGKKLDAGRELAKVSTNRDILYQGDGENTLMNAEEYLAGILPGQVDASVSQEYMEAQAVMLRTQIYATMGDETVIRADELPFTYYTEQDYIKKWGQSDYIAIKEKYDQAVLSTLGKIIE